MMKRHMVGTEPINTCVLFHPRSPPSSGMLSSHRVKGLWDGWYIEESGKRMVVFHLLCRYFLRGKTGEEGG